MSKKQIFLMFIGLPASGKSTEAKAKESEGFKVFSSDALRAELYGDEEDNSHNNELFVELHKRIKAALTDGENVIYDATNISKNRRIAFLDELKSYDCMKCAMLFIAPYEELLERNSNRNRVVPESVMRRMYEGFCPPHHSEGFDEISISYTGSSATLGNYDINKYLFDADLFDQENKHHSSSLGSHSRKAAEIVVRAGGNQLLAMAALLHDCGKPATKTYVNAKGVDDGDCHYYNHQKVGAYESIMFGLHRGLSTENILYMSNLIYYHMDAYIAWKDSAKPELKTYMRIGKLMYADLCLLHIADRMAH